MRPRELPLRLEDFNKASRQAVKRDGMLFAPFLTYALAQLFMLRFLELFDLQVTDLTVARDKSSVQLRIQKSKADHPQNGLHLQTVQSYVPGRGGAGAPRPSSNVVPNNNLGKLGGATTWAREYQSLP